MTDNSAPVHELSRAIADATRDFFLPVSLDATLQGVTDSAVALIDAADCADILIVEGPRKFRSRASTSQLPLVLDALQEKLNEGPCVDAARRGTVVRCDDLATDKRWPRYGPEAVRAGVRSTLSFCLYTSENTIGALNVFALTPGAFSVNNEELGAVLATHAAVALYTADKTYQFESALASRDIIGQAKGMIMERFGVDAVRAFEMLKTLSQNDNVPIATLAARLVQLGPETRPAT